jgi:hypothetical protein
VESGYKTMAGQSTTGDIVLEAAACPRNLIGEPGRGLALALGRITVNRLLHCPAMVGLARVALNDARDYARRAPVRPPIAQFQAIQHMLADMATQLAAARALMISTARQLDAGGEARAEASMAKLFCSEAAFRIADAAVQIHGGEGIVQGRRVEFLFRMLRMYRVLTGTSEIQKNIIARELLGRGAAARLQAPRLLQEQQIGDKTTLNTEDHLATPAARCAAHSPHRPCCRCRMAAGRRPLAQPPHQVGGALPGRHRPRHRRAHPRRGGRPLLGQPIIIENKGGAAGNIGARPGGPCRARRLHLDLLGRAHGRQRADVREPRLRRDEGLSPRHAPHHVGRAAGRPSLVGHRDAAGPHRQGARQPGKLDYASGGVGTPSHLGVELFLNAAGVQRDARALQGRVGAGQCGAGQAR